MPCHDRDIQPWKSEMRSRGETDSSSKRGITPPVSWSILRASRRILDCLRPVRLDERQWHDALMAAVAQEVGCETGLSLRTRRPAPLGARCDEWLQQHLRYTPRELRLAEQAHVAIFLSPRCAKTWWFRLRTICVQHCSTPLGDILGVLYHVPKSGIVRCTLMWQGSTAKPLTARHQALVRVLGHQLCTDYRHGYLDPVGDALEGLSDRELRALRLLLNGHREAEIARLMTVSQHTVHTHVKSLYRSFRVASRGELLSLFIEPVIPGNDENVLPSQGNGGRFTLRHVELSSEVQRSSTLFRSKP